MEKQRYRVTVKHDEIPNFLGMGGLDEKIEALAPKSHVGSGYCFSTGKRDVEFIVVGYDKALKLAARARKLKKGVTAIVTKT